MKYAKWLFVLGVILGILTLGCAVGYGTALVKDEPIRTRTDIMSKIKENISTGFVYFRDQSLVGQLLSGEDSRPIPLSEIPSDVKNATIAVEDAGFYSNFGIDINGFLRAATEKLLHEPVQTGGSTITQQLARRVFLNLDRTYSRKGKEILLALRMQRMMSKDEILEAYLNKIPYGIGSAGYYLYGIEAASKGIFNISDLSKLNIAQAAYLAGIPQQPNVYSAFAGDGKFDPQGFHAALGRQRLVLRRMLETKVITQQQYQEALSFDLPSSLAATKPKANDTYPYLMMEVEKRASNILLQLQNPQSSPEELKKNVDGLKGEQELLLHNGYKIYTTVDKTIYDDMHEIAENPKNFTPDIKGKGGEQIGGVMQDSKTGAILGMIEGRGYSISKYNHATQMLRQPGSTMKPIAAYLPAIEKGLIQPASIIDDEPIILKDGQKGFHIPLNWDDKFHGLITARTALNKSYNIPAIDIFLNKVGIETAWGYAKKMGITSLTKSDNYAQTGVIGGLEYGVSVEEMTNAYQTMANKGVFNDAYLIDKIEDGNGSVIYQHQSRPVPVVTEQSAYLMTDMLRTVISDPGGTAADLQNKFKHYGKISIVGKTGSTQNDNDAWFEGYTPDITFGVWAGYDQPSPLTKGKGTLRAKQIWASVMDNVIEKKPELFPTKEFTRPDDIVKMTVSDVSGLLPSALNIQTQHTVTDLFNKKYIPTKEDDVLQQMNVIDYQGAIYLPNPHTPMDMMEEKQVVRRQKPVSVILQELQTAMQKLPAANGRSISDYKPTDGLTDVPTEVDPRIDDGMNPSPPSGLVLQRKDNSVDLIFQSIPNPNVVGYRVYRSVNHGKFEMLRGKVVLNGQENKLDDQIPITDVFGYYLTAVDVVGKESQPSNIVFTDRSPSDSPPAGVGASNSDKTTNIGQ
ncbi:transglycosylase domain-containing protein [Paenibacillus alginolyticus]|uniref:Transglycosylase domain-containing protein n=1 Tax=Paenibacillus alginolyticus TaxID=59839 RepID=A0ABT4GN36_9BACL|nr:transglycosylase domain-containing protein [Paenibacillus alginolyticus]MCY9697627.1 transglycosylase domain-containing protein [Paenibacillus alginolyticus]MEC0144894.1 transglycosylase domain-containing protein [Paenibacillus alginolyticus]